MLAALRAKFAAHAGPRQMLLATASGRQAEAPLQVCCDVRSWALSATHAAERQFWSDRYCICLAIAETAGICLGYIRAQARGVVHNACG